MTFINMKDAIGQLKHDTYEYEDRCRSDMLYHIRFRALLSQLKLAFLCLN